MKKLVYSTFALSLIFAHPLWSQSEEGDEFLGDFLGLEAEVLPELKGAQRFTPQGLHSNPEWNVKVSDALVDKEPLKGQGYSIIPWKGIDPEKFLDIHGWLSDREKKDQVKDWQIRLRDARHSEMIGKVLKCNGVCPLYRGTTPVNIQHLSRVLEGDEVQTDDNSDLWIYLMDGTLVRLAAKTSVSFHEINFSSTESLVVVRLNAGHIYWHPRSTEPLELNTSPETDSRALPLMVREANLQYFERVRFQKQNDRQHLTEVFNLGEGAIQDQVQKLNDLRKKQPNKLRHRVMMVAPNVTLLASESSFDMVHVPGGKTFFKRRSAPEGSQFSVLLRGYTNTEENSLDNLNWHETLPDGRSFGLLAEVPGDLQILELLTRRIRTLELARELWFAKFTLPVLKDLNDSKKLATRQGYNLWGEELEQRLSFLKEHSRRVETTHLKSQENLLARLEAAGEKQETELSSALYESALNHYALGLKERYNVKNLQVREMNNLQYYVWILKNGKF